MNLQLKTYCFKPNFCSFLLRYSTSSPQVIEQNVEVLIDDVDATVAKEAEIEKKRNKSRLSAGHLNVIHGRRPYENSKCLAHLTVKYNRKLYGKYGIASGINPSLCWPSKQDIQDIKEYEAVAFPYTIRKIMNSVARKNMSEKLKIEQREQELAAKFAKLEFWKKDLNDRIAKKEAEARAAKEKKERLVDEVRRHFGFKIDPRDERFQEMLAKREKQQKKLEKQARKEAKEKTVMAKIQQQNVQMKEKDLAS